MKISIVTALAFLLLAGGATGRTVTYGWEDGAATILGQHAGTLPAVSCAPVGAPDPVSEGAFSLRLERVADATPQAFLVHVWGLTDADEVIVSVDRYDATPGAAPSGRLWAHFNDDLPADAGGYSGSAGGNSDYGEGLGWDNTSHTWTVEGGHTGLTIEFRVYSNPGDVMFVDNLSVTAPEGCWIQTPDRVTDPDGVAVTTDRGTWGGVKALFR
jgi:hypothetical protein